MTCNRFLLYIFILVGQQCSTCVYRLVSTALPVYISWSALLYLCIQAAQHCSTYVYR